MADDDIRRDYGPAGCVGGIAYGLAATLILTTAVIALIVGFTLAP